MLVLDRLGKVYPNGVNALERFSADIKLGEIVAIIGGSGCGKSTLLRAIAGLGLGWMFVLAAEFLGDSTGIGFLLIEGQQLGKPAQIVAAIVAFAILGKLTDWMIAAISAPFLRWEDRVARN